MVCIYCGAATQVTNSRQQKRDNRIWRRRKCLACSSVFTTTEQVEHRAAFMVESDKGKLRPFNRDQLFVAIYESCKHRTAATDDASSLTQTVINRVLETQTDGVVRRQELIRVTLDTLKKFDRTAAAVYEAYHPL